MIINLNLYYYINITTHIIWSKSKGQVVSYISNNHFLVFMIKAFKFFNFVLTEFDELKYFRS